MSETYLLLADGFEKLAAAYRALAGCKGDVKCDSREGEAFAPSPVTEQKEKSQVSIETVRAVLAERSREGKTVKVKALLRKYDCEKLSEVRPEDYTALLAEAEVL